MRRVLRLAVVLLLLPVFLVVRARACAVADDADSQRRLDYLAERIAQGTLPGLAPGHPFDGEWKLVALSMAVVAATNLAHREPETKAARAEQVAAWTRRLVDDDVRAYDTRQWGHDPLELQRPEGHAGYLGHVALALGAACLLGAPRDAALHRAIVDALARRVDASPTGLIETYPGETYVPDNVVVVAGISLYQRCAKDAVHADTVRRFLTKTHARWLDADTGLWRFAPGQPSRGSGAAWSAFYLVFIDENAAREEAAGAWRVFGDTTLFGWLRGVRDRPVGDARGGDVDTGPLIFGVSPSATGFLLGPATLAGDTEAVHGILTTAELAGVSFHGRYLTSPLVGDAITLAARTMTRWP